ncbi:MAG: hypothetical protein WBP26_00320 [Candidatus Saccharimonadales bacterium]
MDEQLTQIRDEIVGYPELSASVVGNEIHIKGKLDLGLGEDDAYDIKIVLDEHYPLSPPRTYETAGRIKQTLDRHYFTGDDASCCLCIPHQLRKRFPVDEPISTYIDDLVIPYFKNQIHYEITGEYVSEYSHGLAGIFEFYQDLFDSKNPYVILRLIKAVTDKQIKNYLPCPCGGKKRLRKCHMRMLKELKRYASPGQLAKDLENFQEILERAERQRQN